MSHTIGHFEPIQIELLPDGRRGKFLRELDLHTKDGKKHTIPVDFITDFASTPRFAWRIFPPWGPYAHAAAGHDLLYQTGAVSRKEADQLFLEWMEQLKINWFTRTVMYRSVRLGGWRAWNQYRRLENT